MNKKTIAIALVLVMVAGSVFAASSIFNTKSTPATKVGLQLGYGGRSITVNATSTSTKTSHNYKNNGFYAAGSFEFGVAKDLSVKIEAGLNTMGNTSYRTSIGGASWGSSTKKDDAPINFTIFTGAMYNLALNKELSVNLGGGLDVMVGKLSSSEDAKVNAAIGIGAEAGISYAINNQISIIAGGKFGWHFFNTNDDMQEYSSSDNHSTTNLSYKGFAGVTYAL